NPNGVFLNAQFLNDLGYYAIDNAMGATRTIVHDPVGEQTAFLVNQILRLNNIFDIYRHGLILLLFLIAMLLRPLRVSAPLRPGGQSVPLLLFLQQPDAHLPPFVRHSAQPTGCLSHDLADFEFLWWEKETR